MESDYGASAPAEVGESSSPLTVAATPVTPGVSLGVTQAMAETVHAAHAQVQDAIQAAEASVSAAVKGMARLRVGF